MRRNEPRFARDDDDLIVRLPDGDTCRFSSPFHIGRDPGCDVQLTDVHVSRRHVEVTRVRGQWMIRDLQSSNGVFVDGERVDTAPVGEGVTVTVGTDGPTLELCPAALVRSERTEETTLNALADRYFTSEDDGDESAGDRTLMIRKAFQKVQQQQRRRHRWTIALAALVALGAGTYAFYAYRAVSRHTAQAREIFYGMKEQEMIFADLEQRLAKVGDAPGQQQVAQYMARRRDMERNYEQYVAGLYDRRLNERDRLILRVTRMFGECDVAAPPDYTREVLRYIELWRSTGRFESALKRAQENGYTKKIAAAFQAQNLPPQYFYLAMQESDFIPTRSGPPTRYGYAKGMWQFIPDTGRRYGLRIGPYASEPRIDLQDDRLNWELATQAAARYIKDIYSTDAQASGLLVMASYNWGEHRIDHLVDTLPKNPRQRNFWKLLERYREKMPRETYNYVFYIVSAAVIGENPRLFGFQLDNPLSFTDNR